MYRSILVATDGSDRALNGVKHGIALADVFDAQLTALMVAETGEVADLPCDEIGAIRLESYPSELAAYFASLARESLSVGVEIRSCLVGGESPSQVIKEVASKIEADLIIMTTHGHSGLRREVLGSQTLELLGCSEVPVLVVR